jgi:predicted dehydrogenase
MNAPYRIAIIGCGKIAAAHALAAISSPLTQLTCLVDTVPARAHALAERFGLTAHVLTSVDQVVGLADGAIIATPNHAHAGPALRCLEAGIAILVEKPLALTAAEGRQICDVAARKNALVAVGYTSRFRDNVRLMKRLIDDRHFGRITRFAYQFGTRGGWAPVSGYNLDRRTSGGGVLVTTGTHFLDRLLYWFGYPDDSFLTHDGVNGPEANAEAHFAYRGNDEMSGIARFSKTTPLPAGITLESEAGLVVLKDRSDARIVVRPPDKPDLEISIGRSRPAGEDGNEFVKQLEDFVLAARGLQAPMVSGEQGMESLRLLDHLYGHQSWQRQTTTEVTHANG